jgi:inosose dehydratase
VPVGALRRQRARRLRHPPRLGRAGLGHPAGNLNRIDAVATQHDVRAVLYPRVGTMIERGDERYGGARGCLGSPRCPCAWTPSPAHRRHRPRRTDLASPGRIAHPHEGRRPRPGPPGAVRARTYTEAVGDGMYRPLGRGMSMSLRSSGTCASRATAVGASSSKTPSSPRNPLTEELRGEGPVADVHTSAEYLLSVISSSG